MSVHTAYMHTVSYVGRYMCDYMYISKYVHVCVGVPPEVCTYVCTYMRGSNTYILYVRTFLLSVVTSIALGMNNAVFCFARHKISSNRMATCEERKVE